MEQNCPPFFSPYSLRVMRALRDQVSSLADLSDFGNLGAILVHHMRARFDEIYMHSGLTLKTLCFFLSRGFPYLHVV